GLRAATTTAHSYGTTRARTAGASTPARSTFHLDRQRAGAGQVAAKGGPTMRNLIRGFIALAFSGAVAAPALAGIADTPLPKLVLDVSTQHLYSVPDVVNTATLGTYFSCTSTSSSSMWVSVELFDGTGTVANSANLDEFHLGAGASVRFGTGFAL